MTRRVLPLLFGLLWLAAPASAAKVPEGAEWTQATIKSGDGTQLHADILRPKGLPKEARTPVILSIGPYFNHSGQTGPAGPAEGTDFDPTGPVEGPSDRFTDFVEGAKLMQRGYSFVMVDLRGFGGSGGCLDWGGPGEQGDVKAAVEWAASQPWSTGQVGMYGKSYDGVTGLIGEVLNPKGLKAVVSMEPVYDLYRYLYSNGVRYENSGATPALYDAIAVTPGPLLDDPLYNASGATTPDCLAANYASQQNADHGSDYWKARDLIAKASQGKTPLFMTQGFLENNTKPDGTWDFFNNLKGPNRAWFGMWDHVRGNETDGARLKEGRAGYFDEVMRFFDHYVRDVPLADAPVDKDPKIAVQTSDGTWRAETQWPPADSTPVTVQLTPGVYSGDGQNDGTGSAAGHGLWTISPPLDHDAWYSGVPTAKLDLTGDGNPLAGVVVDTYDIDADRRAILLSREASLVGGGKLDLKLYGNDWKIPAGHRLGVLVTDTNEEWWLPSTPSMFTLNSGSVTLPFLKYTRPETIQGDSAVRLEQWLASAPFTVDESVITAATKNDFPLPAPLTAAPAGSNPEPTTPVGSKKRLTVRIALGKHRRVSIYGNAPASAKLRIRLYRVARAAGKRNRLRLHPVRGRRVTTKINAFRVAFRLKHAGRYQAGVTAKVGGKTLTAKTKRIRVR
jgi:pimeloyl-ACP methyl ester carboxylesterase